MRKGLVSAVLLIALLSCTHLFCQTATGIPPFSSTIGGPDVINLGNLNVHWAFPIVNKPGRGLPFLYALTFDNSIWYPVGSSGNQSWQPVPNWGWQVQTSASVGYLKNQVATGTCQYGFHGSQTAHWTITLWKAYIDQFGTSHPFPDIETITNDSGGACGPVPGGPPTSGTATDGSAIKFDAISGLVTFTNGTAMHPPTQSTGPGTETDRNGNQITTAGDGNFVDTLGTTALTITSGNPVAYKYKDATGTQRPVNVNYATKTVLMNFPCTGVSPYGPISQSLVSSIVYPDGSSYVFQYEQTPGQGDPNVVTGRLASVTLLSGGTISYSYTGGTNGIICSDGSTAGLNRTTPDSAQPSTYSRTNPSGSAWTTTVQSPLSDKTVVNFQLAGNNFYETSRYIYQGQDALLEILYSCYNGASASCDSTGITLPITEGSAYRTIGSHESRTDTFYNGSFSGSGLVSEVDEYDLVSGSWNLLRKTLAGYASLGNNIFDRANSITVQDGNGNQKAYTSYGYDEGGLTSTSGIPQHIGISGSRGNLTSVNQWLNTTGGYLTTSIFYEDTGNVLATTDSGGHGSQFSYTDNFEGGQTPNAHAYVTTTTLPVTHSPNTANHVTTAKYDINTGLVTDSGDQNGNHTTFSYDAMLRPIQANFPDGGKTSYTYYYVSNVLTQMWTWNYLDATNHTDFRQHVDSMGRFDRTARWNPQGTWDMQDICFNAKGQLGFSSYAYQNIYGWGVASVCSGAGDAYTYDALSRPTQITHSDGSSVQYAYTGRATQISDEGNGSYNVTRILQNDALGRLTSVCEIGSTPLNTPGPCGLDISGTGFGTSYGYDTLNNVTHIDQGGYATRTFGYDSLSRMTSESFPEQFGCATSYSYNNDSLVSTRTRPAPNQGSCGTTVTTTYAYDEGHRLRTRSYSDGLTPPNYYSYDESNPWGATAVNPIGNLTTAVTNNVPGTATLAGDIFPDHDAIGRVRQNGKCTPRTCGWTGYTHFYSYDYLGDVTSFNNANLYTLTQNYNSAGRLTSATSSLVDSQHPANLVSNISYGPFGVTSDSLGNGISESFGYAARGALSAYTAGTAYSFSLGLTSDYNIVSANDSVNGNWSYGYDQFNRLANASKTGVGLTWVYDRFGNRWQQNGPGGGNPQYTIDTNNHITGSRVTYDALGNVLNDGIDGIGHSFTYDAENRVTNANGTAYVYDAFGRRVKNGSYELLYDLDGSGVALLDANSGGWAYGEIYASGRHLATYSGGTTNFVHTDWLGTKRAMTSISGMQSMTCAGLPYGESSSCVTSWNFNSFTDDFHDSESNTEHTLFRQLSTTQGRWLSPDPYLGSVDLTNPQSLNRYAYVLNSPIVFNDPLGLDPPNCGHDSKCWNDWARQFSGGMVAPGGPRGAMSCEIDGVPSFCDSAFNMLRSGTAHPVGCIMDNRGQMWCNGPDGERDVPVDIVVITGNGHFIGPAPSPVSASPDAQTPPSKPSDPCLSILRSAVVNFLGSFAPPEDFAQTVGDSVGAAVAIQDLWLQMTSAARKIGVNTLKKMSRSAAGKGIKVALTVNGGLQLASAELEAAQDGKICNAFLPMGPVIGVP